MKRFMTIFALALFVMAPAAMAQNQYGFTLSDSAVDPNSNTGAAPTGGVLNIYVWLACAPADGLSAAEFDVSGPGGAPLAFTALNGFLNAGGGTNLLLATPCTNGPVNAGTILALDTGAGDYCLVASAANGKNVSVDCTDFNEWANDVIGYNNSGGAAACADALCQPVSVEDSSWGAVKSLYR